MSSMKLDGEYLRRGCTSVDNIFLQDYLPEADAEDVRIYLYGLTLTSQAEGTIASVAEKLQISEKRATDGFLYWQKKGLVSLSSTDPVCVTYLSVREPQTAVVKINTEKYKVFVDEATRIYPDRVLMPNDLNAYIELMQSEKMETNAMLLVMQYCKELGGGKTSTRYVCAVAKAWAERGYNTEKKVAEHIGELENNNEELRMLFDTLGIKRGVCIEDRQMYFHWTEAGFAHDAVLTAARLRKKKGGMEKLDAYMEELKKANAMTATEIVLYTENKEKIHSLAVDICKNLGVYYSNTENLTEVYIMPWLNRGFEADALIRLSKYCFLRNVHTFEVMKQMVEKVASLGLFTEKDITAYVGQQVALDETIRKVYECCGYVGGVTNRDRESYKAWAEWGFSEEVIMTVAHHFAGTSFPLQAMGRTFGTLRNSKIFSLDGVNAFLKGGEKRTTEEYQKHQYSDEELKNALVNFDNWE